MDFEIEAPIDDLEALVTEDDEDILGDAELVTPSYDPTVCS
jgi:hypothetical protein